MEKSRNLSKEAKLSMIISAHHPPITGLTILLVLIWWYNWFKSTAVFIELTEQNNKLGTTSKIQVAWSMDTECMTGEWLLSQF